MSPMHVVACSLVVFLASLACREALDASKPVPCPLEDGALVSRGKHLYLISDCHPLYFHSGELVWGMGLHHGMFHAIGNEVWAQLREGGNVVGTPFQPLPLSEQNATSTLLSLRASLNATKLCSRCAYESAAKAFLFRYHAPLLKEALGEGGEAVGGLGGAALLLHPLCLCTSLLGEGLASFFESVAVAQGAGAHLLALPGPLSVLLSQSLSPSLSERERQRQGRRQRAFLSSLPQVLAHARPGREYSVRLLLYQEETCYFTCYERRESKIWRAATLIRDLLLPALSNYLQADPELRERGTALGERDLLFSPQDVKDTKDAPVFLPLLPSVALHFPCDPSRLSSYYAREKAQGLVSFTALRRYLSRHHPLGSNSTVFVLTDREREGDGVCEKIRSELAAYLHTSFPSATVALVRERDPILSLYRLVHAQTTLCSSSPLCLVASLSHAGARAYLPPPKGGPVEGVEKGEGGLRWMGRGEVVGGYHQQGEWLELLKREGV